MDSQEQIIIAESLDKAVAKAAERVVGALSHGSGSRSVALSGGSTPKALHQLLTKPPYRDRVDWSRVEWFWGDERAVPPDHADSNYRMARETLLEPLGIVQRRIHRMPADAADLDTAAAEYERVIRLFVPDGPTGIPVFDLILLGMGNDGHAASLFPGSAGLEECQRLVVAHQVPSLGVQRMTLTYPVLQSAKEILFLVTGESKAEALAKVLSPANDSGLPAAALRPGGAHPANGRLIWILDGNAARVVQSAKSA